MVFIKHAYWLYVIFFFALLIPYNKNRTIEVEGDAIDKTRFIIISCVSIAVFAADFPFYHLKRHKLGKSMSDGLKLMDIGVGSFVYNGGFFSTFAKPHKKIKIFLFH